jgi:hypothetical protein
VAPEDRINACVFVTDRKELKGVRNEWALNELSKEIMRGPADTGGIVDESMSAYAIFAPVSFKTNDLPEIDTARLKKLFFDCE